MGVDTIITLTIVIYSIILHEIAHGYVAYLCGDNTARDEGRLTLNPIPHIDPVGSIMVPAMGALSGLGIFGWAKGVPVNIYNLNSRFKNFAVSAAGIVTNLLIATLFLILIKLGVEESLNHIFFKVAVINIGLGFFNLMPIPPFDGMSMLRSFYPSLYHKYSFMEHNPGFMIIAILFASYLFSFIYGDIVSFIIQIFGLN
jgi:Zn-dependent protease